ncbi:ubiquinone/menaquinone biosynthesis methyltransferase [Candidatus Kinetoplastibacterium oncopeltii TCC290E]|uniref:Ubiquinone/menaquinone biosynthesis C-methyltransferase UbiE n=1 Tax=Candidatus Kinetoplastidibacterium stringomonadis TCC290E TaxID=1208920 RepID=M1LY39_9PROT|nr:class I SAM-dependent methyltransferase [Candidatus Kinetoplastibacterium oncopeltii]AGF48089.1 ubiquinone/menaquinone biosynthesis methyltransferase [Candidatus Kinetoplastibacterium oncopeltii TCC290E]
MKDGANGNFLENENSTHFGYKFIETSEKKMLVSKVFDSVADQYDLMNDLMSLGLHRLWKKFLISKANIRPGMKILDIAGGTGDLARMFIDKHIKNVEIWLTDINIDMLNVGYDRLINSGYILPIVACDAESLPFASSYFDRISVSFGLRNMTNKMQAMSEMRRVLKPGGKLLILEFSQIIEPLRFLYDYYSFKFLPWLGNKITGDGDSYRYLVESIRMHPKQDVLAQMMIDSGFRKVKFSNLNAGIVALHEGIKID